MRNYFLSLLAVLFLATPLSAQYFGLRAGVINTNATIDFTGLDVDTDGESNLMLGIFADLPIGSDVFSIQPELNYLNRGYSYSITAGGNEFSQNLAYIDLTTLAKLNFGRKEGLGFYVGVGPTFSYALSGQVTDVNGERDVDFGADNVNRSGLNFSGVGGLTFDIGLKLFVEARYVGAVSNLFKDEDTDVRQRYVGINGGVLVPLGIGKK